MRARIEKEKGTSDIWDIKNVSGGLVDLEFIVQFLQLAEAHEHPGVLNQNTAKSLEKLASIGALDEADAQALIPAATLFHNLTQILRLCLENPFDRDKASPGLKNLLARAGAAESFEDLEKLLETTLKAVREAFDRIVN